MLSVPDDPELRQLLAAYANGVFPMADSDNGEIQWYLPHERGIIPLDNWHLPRSLRKFLRHNRFQITVNADFEQTIRMCAHPAPDRPETWISEELIRRYVKLHHAGFAHSVEVHQDGQQVGGLYGVALRGLFAGESMYSRRTNASKAALVFLLQRLNQAGYALLDTQYYTEHLGQFGAVTVTAQQYARLLSRALAAEPEPFSASSESVRRTMTGNPAR